MVGMGANDRPRREPRPGVPVRARDRHEFNRRLRIAFIAGAEDRSRQDWGRGLTETELRAILEHYPGDLASEDDTF
jgi:hypothetical protein